MTWIVLAFLHAYYLARAVLYGWLWWSAKSFKSHTHHTNPDDILPVYTILAPMYKDAKLVPQLLKNISKLDYPKHLLQIIFVFEKEDREAYDAVWAVAPDHTDLWIEMMICSEPSKGQPKTKPRALNFAMAAVEGEFLVIYDAEDEPEPDQLLKAVEMFKDQKLGCVQARLNYRNFKENWIARMFATEYATWFDSLIPGLAKNNMPIPLGGTSNHIRTKVVKDLGGWDPLNVTEDCELGLRLYSEGYGVGWLDSVTWEEACCRFWPWVKQRTRWIKGYMYTWSRSGFEVRDVKALISWHLFVLGTPLVALCNPIFWAITVAWLLGYDTGWLYPYEWVRWTSLACLIGGNLIAILVAFEVSWRLGRRWNAVLSVTFPLYWAMMSIAGYRALWQMIWSPSVWEKTAHGISDQDHRKQT